MVAALGLWSQHRAAGAAAVVSGEQSAQERVADKTPGISRHC